MPHTLRCQRKTFQTPRAMKCMTTRRQKAWHTMLLRLVTHILNLIIHCSKEGLPLLQPCVCASLDPACPAGSVTSLSHRVCAGTQHYGCRQQRNLPPSSPFSKLLHERLRISQHACRSLPCPLRCLSCSSRSQARALEHEGRCLEAARTGLPSAAASAACCRTQAVWNCRSSSSQLHVGGCEQKV